MPARTMRAGGGARAARIQRGLRTSFVTRFLLYAPQGRLERASKELSKPGRGRINVILDYEGFEVL